MSERDDTMPKHQVYVRDFLVYVDGNPVYINVLFAERNQIKEGSKMPRYLLEHHNRTIPEDMESDDSDYFMTGTKIGGRKK